jgi:hypothetical protein
LTESTAMRYYLLSFELLISFCLSGQGDYYITKNGDTVQCEFKKVLPHEIKVKNEKDEVISLDADEIKGFANDGIGFASKKIVNQKKKPYIFLPDDATDRKYQYDKEFKPLRYTWVEVNLVMMSGKGVVFYELTELGRITQNGRDVTTTFYIENDSLGLSKVPYLSAIGGSAEQTDVIDALYNYLKIDGVIEKKLNVNEPWKTFNYKGIRKLITEFMGKEFVD